jgi:hypothetical protein
MGSFLRARTLQSVAESSRGRAGIRSSVTIQVLDPAIESVCEAYATYRGSMDEKRASATASNWSAERVRLECLATIVAAAWYVQHEDLEIRLGVLNFPSTLRFDVSQDVALVTNEDPDFPALAVRKQSKLYFAIVRDLDMTLMSARPIDLQGVPSLPREWQRIDRASLREFGMTVGVGSGLLTDENLERLIDLSFKRQNDYFPGAGQA